MPKKRKEKQNQPDESSRPRVVSESKRVIQHGIEKTQQRKSRELSKTRGPGTVVRPIASSSGLIQHHEKRFPTGRTAELARSD